MIFHLKRNQSHIWNQFKHRQQKKTEQSNIVQYFYGAVTPFSRRSSHWRLKGFLLLLYTFIHSETQFTTFKTHSRSAVWKGKVV